MVVSVTVQLLADAFDVASEHREALLDPGFAV